MKLTEAQYIEKRPQRDPTSDFESLFQEALGLIQKLTGHQWTDFNIHDPGITILEQLCFALTDLHYKTAFNIEDILTNPKGLIDRRQHSFFERQQILTCNPVTVNDFRKIILDNITELDNVMLTPVLSLHNAVYMKGLYKMQIRVNGSIATRFETEPELKNDLKERIRMLYLSKRNLCEDVIDRIVIMEPQIIRLHANITISDSSSPEQTLLAIYNKIESLLNPKITFHSESELLGRGHQIEEIFNGPLLNNGFILDRDLKPIDTQIDLIDITNSITNLSDVVYIQKIKISNQPKSVSSDNEENGQAADFEFENDTIFELKKDHFPYLDLKTFSHYVTLYSDDYRLPINEVLLMELYNRGLQLDIRKRPIGAQNKTEDTIKAGTYKNLRAYHSIQNHFPNSYGIGLGSLSKNNTNERKAAAKQLKVYLTFFEQVLANYTAQLANIDNLYSTNLNKPNRFSYFTQPLYNVPGIQDVLKNYASPTNNPSFNGDFYEIEKKWKDFQKDENNGYVTQLRNAIETPEVFLERKSKILDHLLARFNRKLSVLPIQHYFNIYMKGDSIERDTFILQWKAHILNNLITIDQGKIRAYNYLSEINEMSGFEYKVSLYLNINQAAYPKLNQFKKNAPCTRRKLSGVFNDGKNIYLGNSNQDRSQSQSNAYQTIRFNEEELKIVTNTNEPFDLSEIKELKDYDASKNNANIFQGQTISLFEFGINKENYRIVPSMLDKNEFIIIYKSPSKEKKTGKDAKLNKAGNWSIVSSHPSKKAAASALDDLIAYLTKLSIDAEGFHLIEHLLLRPRLDQPCFGFRFYDGPDSVIFQNDSWTNFDERDNFLTKLKLAFKNEGDTRDGAPLYFQVKNKDTGLFTRTTSMHNEDSNMDIKKAIAELNYLGENNSLSYPCIKFTVKLSDTKIVEEDFYSFKATVVLPSWPARFQDNEFRLFTENIFKALAPAYLNLNFWWLGISSMQNFEVVYFDWLENNKSIDAIDVRMKSCLGLTNWLQEAAVKKHK